MYKLVLTDNCYCHYELIQSARAKYIRIKISPAGEVKVVVPQRVKNQLAHDFVQQRKDWIKETLRKIEQQPVLEITRPEQLNLQFINENWAIDYKPTSYNGVILTPDKDTKRLLVEGMTDDQNIIFSVLEQWLKNKARQAFPATLDEIALKHGFNYNRVTIRGQKTRWGSCSSKQNINLNYKLLFFPDEVVRYVFIHELCHTHEMNHSQRFWDLVERCDADYQQHRQVLKKKSEDYLPAGLM